VLHRAAIAEDSMRLFSMTMLCTIAALSSGISSSIAQDRPGQSWVEVKCERYKKAWAEALKRRGTKGIGPEFLDRHEAFLASGCTAQADVCPRSTEEFDLANMMVVAAMNAGTASTFPPFSCRK
jgi:hypothetical protein